MKFLKIWLPAVFMLAAAASGANARPLPLVPQSSKVIYVKLSNDKEVRNQQFAELAAQVNAAKTAAQSNKKNGNGSASADFYDCGGSECFFEPTMYVFEQDIGSDASNPVLERVVVQGWCKILIGNTEVYCADAQSHLEQMFPSPPTRRVAEEKTAVTLGQVAETLKDNIEWISPLRKKCVVTPPSNPVKTPDDDEAQDFYMTKASIIFAFTGDMSNLRFASRVDVLYPSGFIARFIITSFTPPKNGEQVNLNITRIGSPGPEESPCKS